MVTFRVVPKAESAAIREAHYRKRAPAAAPRPKSQNFAPVLAFGDIEAFLFRGRAYGVPPLPYKAGLELLELWTEASDLGSNMSHAVARRYGAIIRRIAVLLWKHTRVVGKGRRMLRRLGLFRNPFAEATEAELVDLAARFLARRRHTITGPRTTGTADRLHPSTA
jgi:hypothetical protein